MSQDQGFGDIYHKLFEQFPPYVHQPPWDVLPVPDGIRRPPEDAAAVVNHLLAEHSEQALIEAHVLVPHPSHGAPLNPVLCQAGSAIIALRESEASAPFDLLAGGVTLTGQMLPVCASLRDGWIQKMIRKAPETVLCACPTSADVAVLLSMNIPATFDTGLAQLAGPGLRQVRKDFVSLAHKSEPPFGIINDPGDVSREAGLCPDLLCLGWSLAALSNEQPPGFGAMVAHLTAVEANLGLCLDRFYCWQAEQDEIQQIAFCLEVGGRKSARKAIITSIRNSSMQLISPPAKPDDSPKDLAEAIEAIERLRSRSRRDYGDERKAWQKLHTLLHEESIKPLFEAMEAAEDPIERSHWLLAAINARLLHPQHARLLLWMTEDPDFPGALEAFPDTSFRQLMQITDRQRRIFKDIIEYRNTSTGSWK